MVEKQGGGKKASWKAEVKIQVRAGGAVRWLEEIIVWPNPGSRTGKICSSMGCRTGRGEGQSSIPFL